MDTTCAAAGKPQKTAFLHLARHHQGKLSGHTQNAVFGDLRSVASSDQQGGYRCKTCNPNILSEMIYADKYILFS